MMNVEYFDVLDLPADNEKRLFDFLKKYKGRFAVCIHGEDDTERFIELRDKIHDMGFEFLL